MIKKKKLPEANTMTFQEADLIQICKLLNRLLKFGAGIEFDIKTVQWWYTADKYIDFNDHTGKFQVCDKFEGWQAPTDKFVISISDQ